MFEAPWAVCERTPEPLVYSKPLSVVKPEKVIVPEDVNPVKPVRVPAPIRFAPLAVRASVPPGVSCTSPVFVSPRVRVCLAVVARVPVAVNDAPPAVPAESDAVGVPELTLRTANLAEVEAVAPIKRSKVLLIGYKDPLVWFHQLVALPKAHDPHVGVPVPPDKRHWEVVPTALKA